MRKIRKMRLKMIIIFFIFNLVFDVVLAPFIIFWGPFEAIQTLAVGSVLTSRHPQVVKAFLSDEQISEIVKIKTTADLQVMKENPSLKTEWEGSIPFNKNIRMLIGVTGQLIVYDDQTAHIVTDGHLAEVKLHGDEKYISADGAELIQLTKQGTSTLVELQPLKS